MTEGRKVLLFPKTTEGQRQISIIEHLRAAGMTDALILGHDQNGEATYFCNQSMTVERAVCLLEQVKLQILKTRVPR